MLATKLHVGNTCLLARAKSAYHLEGGFFQNHLGNTTCLFTSIGALNYLVLLVINHLTICIQDYRENSEHFIKLPPMVHMSRSHVSDLRAQLSSKHFVIL
jgi:hypothetical protein